MATPTYPEAGADSKLLRLPLELLLRITDHLTTPELGSVRLTCRRAEAALFPSFAREFFVRRQFMLSPFSLQALIDISASRMGEYLRYLHIHVEEITNPRLGHHHYSFLSSAQYHRHHELYREQVALKQTGQDVVMLAEAMRNLPNLEDVIIRDTNSPTRWRDGLYTRWSYGRATVYRLTGVPCEVPAPFDFQAYAVFLAVIRAVGAAAAPVKGIELLLRKKTIPWDGTFHIPAFLQPSVLPALAGLQKLHLCVGKQPRIAGQEDDFKSEVQSFALRRFLGYLPHLRELRCNSAVDDRAQEFFLDWQARPAGSKPVFALRELSEEEQAIVDASPPSVALPCLETLSLGRSRMWPEMVTKLAGKFAPTLRGLQLWDIRLCAADGDGKRAWTEVFGGLVDMQNVLKLRHLRIGRLGFEHPLHMVHGPADGSIGFPPGDTIEYEGSDWVSFVKTNIAGMTGRKIGK